MNLRHVKTTHCPDCYCSTVVSEFMEIESHMGTRRVRSHENGEWETRGFMCGYAISWFPDMKSTVCTQHCLDTAKAKKINEIKATIANLQKDLRDLMLS